MDGLYCFCCFLFCQPCVMSKLWASSMDHKQCGVINHFGVWCLPELIYAIGAGVSVGITFISVTAGYAVLGAAGLILAVGLIYLLTILRLNTRRKFSIGKPQFNVFDLLCAWCCSPCTTCQELRAVPKEVINCSYQTESSFTVMPSGLGLAGPNAGKRT